MELVATELWCLMSDDIVFIYDNSMYQYDIDRLNRYLKDASKEYNLYIYSIPWDNLAKKAIINMGYPAPVTIPCLLLTNGTDYFYVHPENKFYSEINNDLETFFDKGSKWQKR